MRWIAGVLTAAAVLGACEVPREPDPYQTVPIAPFLGEPVLGSPDAPLQVTEYASTTCGHCKAFHDQVFPRLKAEYIDTGKVKLVWTVMPTPPAAVSLAGAALARCAGETRFFDVIDDLFDRQDALIEASRNPWRLQQQFREIGARHGLTPDQVGTCLDDKAVNERTLAGVKDAPAFVTGTPTFVLNGRQMENETIEGMFAALDAELARAPQPPKP